MDKDLVKDSKRVSWLLRHGAPECHIPIDPAGWVAVADVLRQLRMSEARLNAVVGQNDKVRFERRGSLIRASQGHSGDAVTPEALEASWTPYLGSGPIFHGTGFEAAFSIAREGILPQKRSHVHLAPSPQSKVGKRWACELLLEVDPARVRAHGLGLWTSPNGVVLARRIPPDCVTGVRGLVAKAQPRIPGVRAAFGLPPDG